MHPSWKDNMIGLIQKLSGMLIKFMCIGGQLLEKIETFYKVEVHVRVEELHEFDIQWE